MPKSTQHPCRSKYQGHVCAIPYNPFEGKDHAGDHEGGGIWWAGSDEDLGKDEARAQERAQFERLPGQDAWGHPRWGLKTA